MIKYEKGRFFIYSNDRAIGHYKTFKEAFDRRKTINEKSAIRKEFCNKVSRKGKLYQQELREKLMEKMRLKRMQAKAKIEKKIERDRLKELKLKQRKRNDKSNDRSKIQRPDLPRRR